MRPLGSRCCKACPQTYDLLRQIPNIRTALFSRLGPQTTLSNHRGWADLSNHVLRIHLPLLLGFFLEACVTQFTPGECEPSVFELHNRKSKEPQSSTRPFAALTARDSRG